MMEGNIVETKVALTEESVKQILIAETGKMLSEIPGFMEEMIRQVLFYRSPKRYSSDSPNPTFYEKVIQNTLQPMIEDEVRNIAKKNRKKLSDIIRRAFKAEVIDNVEFENRLIKQLSKFSSNISFYVSSDD